ncbi:MAG: hypothetical protein O3B13_21825 [Planctomycetota bacterium]|nr:hypothetical protein [Planctomycetota bacterium]MDA1165745.1 hypothetical protein [Planctomycetota bacterium]
MDFDLSLGILSAKSRVILNGKLIEEVIVLLSHARCDDGNGAIPPQERPVWRGRTWRQSAGFPGDIQQHLSRFDAGPRHTIMPPVQTTAVPEKPP